MKTKLRILSPIYYMCLTIIVMALGACEKNYPPRIIETEYARLSGIGNTSYFLRVEASDPNQDAMTYLWEANAGEFLESNENPETTWKAPENNQDKTYTITITVSDGEEFASSTFNVVVEAPSFAKVIGFAYYTGTKVPIGGAVVSIGIKTDTTNLKGEYSLDGIRTGRQKINCAKDEFISSSADILVQDGINEANVEITSDLYTSRIYGKIIGNISLEPMPYLTVVILNPNGSESKITGFSNGSGDYEVLRIPRGLRYLIVKDELSIKMETLLYIEDNDIFFNIAVKEPFLFNDSRDNHEYKAVRIGGQIWMAENLAYMPHVSPPYEQGGIWVYGYLGADVQAARQTDNYKTYGCLYNWNTAVGDNHGNGTDICPPGWRLPSDLEWKSVEKSLGMDIEEADSVSWRMTGNVGRKLKASDGWQEDGNGSNSSGFAALPAGSRTSSGNFLGIYGFANFWTGTEIDDIYVYRRYLYYNRDAIGRYTDFKTNGFSVRCIKNE